MCLWFSPVAVHVCPVINMVVNWDEWGRMGGEGEWVGRRMGGEAGGWRMGGEAGGGGWMGEAGGG